MIKKIGNSFDAFVFRSFDKLQEILDQLKKSQGGLPGEVYTSFKKSINAARLYLKTSFSRNLQMHSEIESHCVARAVSDPKNSEFQKQCFQSHSKRCQECDNLQDLLKSFIGLLRSKRSDFQEDLDFIEAEYEVNMAHERIWNHQCHLVRTWIQEARWAELQASMSPYVALVTSDWAMKWEPRWHHEMNSQWYAKKGLYT